MADYNIESLTYTYRPDVLAQLAAHGLCPLPATDPGAVRDAVRDLYKYEIKRLKGQLIAGKFPKSEYAGRVISLRKRYPLLSIPTVLWVERE